MFGTALALTLRAPGLKDKADLAESVIGIEGDILTVSFTVGDAARPTSFDPAADHYVIALKRVKN